MGTISLADKLDENKKKYYIKKLYEEMAPLRIKADISQEDLANVLGVTRQTYGAVERGDREMSWSMYLSLLFFYDNNARTHQMIRTLDVFPQEIFNAYNDGVAVSAGDAATQTLPSDVLNLIGSLDDAALQSLRAMIMVEYARCSKAPDSAVLKAFGGIVDNRNELGNQEETALDLAIQRIRSGQSE